MAGKRHMQRSPHTQNIDLHFWSSAASEQYPRCLCRACPLTECELGLRNLEKSSWAAFAQEVLVLYPLLQSLVWALQLYTWERQLHGPKGGQDENLPMPKELLWTGIVCILDLENRDSTQGRSGLLQSVQKWDTKQLSFQSLCVSHQKYKVKVPVITYPF